MVLSGFRKYFPVFKPVILIEILYDYVGMQVQSFIEEMRVKCDYFYIDEEKGLIKKDAIKRFSDKYFNYLIIPK